MNTTDAQIIQRIESRKHHVTQTLEHIHHMIAGEDWALAIQYCHDLVGVLQEQQADSLVVADSEEEL